MSAGRYNICSGRSEKTGHLAEDFDCRIVHHMASGVDNPVMAMGGERVEGDIGDQTKRGDFPFQLLQRPDNQSIFMYSGCTLLVFRISDRSRETARSKESPAGGVFQLLSKHGRVIGERLLAGF